MISSRAQFLLDNFTPSQLQSGMILHQAKRFESKKAPNGYEIKMVPTRVKGTSIPASTFHKFQSGKWSPSQKTIHKLENLYSRYAYALLKSSGASASEARRHKKNSPSTLLSLANEYRRYVRTVAANKGVDEKFILWGFTKSQRIREDWDSYVKAQSYSYIDEEDEFFDELPDKDEEF